MGHLQLAFGFLPPVAALKPGASVMTILRSVLLTVGRCRVGEENLGTLQTGELELPPGDARVRRARPRRCGGKRGAAATEEADPRPHPRCCFAVGEFEEVPGIFALTRKEPSQPAAESPQPPPPSSAAWLATPPPQCHESALATRDWENPKSL